MTVLVDEIVTYPLARTRGVPERQWSHMVSDSSFEELHAMATSIGMPCSVFQGDHYDVTPALRTAAIARGAEVVSGLQLAERRLRPAPEARWRRGR